MARGRSRTSPEQKADKKARAAAAKAQALASNALAAIPADKEVRDEFWRELDSLIAEGRGVAGLIGQQKKRGSEIYKITKQAMQIRAILNKCPDGVYEATVEQIQLFMADTNRPFQISMKLEPGKGVADDQGSVFDKTGSGDKVAAERGDDPGRARKSMGGPPKAPAIPTPNVGVEGLAAGIKPLEDPEEKRARIEAEKQADAAAFEKPAAAIDAEMANMTPAQKRAHTKKIAEEVFAKGRACDDGAEAPGTYRVQ